MNSWIRSFLFFDRLILFSRNKSKEKQQTFHYNEEEEEERQTQLFHFERGYKYTASWIRNREMLKSNNGRSEAAERASKQAKVLAKTFPFKRVHGCVCVRYVDNLFALISIADDALQLFFRSSCKLFSN